MKQFKIVLIGAGGRGVAYSENIKLRSDKFQLVGVADPIKERREDIKKKFNLADEACYDSWEEMLSQPKIADIAIIATQDNCHYKPAMKAIELGYHLLLEKPVAPTAKECIDIANAAKEKGVQVLVCHVLRYTPFFKAVKKIVMDGTIGEIQSVIQVEAVGNVHQSHSYVRGDWGREDESTPMLLAKSCHDMDMIQWLIDKPCTKVSSFGRLSYFKPENAPAGAPKRCIDGGCPIENRCPYHYKKVYLSERSNKFFRYAVARGYSQEFIVTDEEVLEGLKNTNFGACVYHAGNDVVDHQVVNLEFEGGATASFTMNAFNRGGRYIRIFGTKGELYANVSDTAITVFLFENREYIKVEVEKTEESIVGGHGGGDAGIIEEMYDYMSGSYTGYCAADIDTSVKNHLIGFAAEKARHNDTVEYVAKFSKENGFDYQYDNLK